MTPFSRIALAVLAVALSSSCSIFRQKPPEYDPIELSSGLVVQDILRPVDSDDRAEIGEEVTLHYVLQLEDGTVIDSSRDRGRPVTFVLGSGAIRLPGLEQGLVGQQVLGQRRIHIPSELAYGAIGLAPRIPPNSNLIIDVELLSAVPAEEEPEVTPEDADAPEEPVVPEPA